MKTFASFCSVLAAALAFTANHSAAAQTNAMTDPLAGLVQLLATSEDPSFHLDILKGMSDGLEGRRAVKCPAGWNSVSEKLRESSDARVRELALRLSLTFGSTAALDSMRVTLSDPKAAPGARSNSLFSLLQIKDPTLPPVLRKLLKDPSLRAGALRGLAAFEDAQTPVAILEIYPSLSATEKNAALMTLSSRATYAGPLLDAIAAGRVSSKEMTADIVRQLRTLKDSRINEQVAKTWGITRETEAEKLKDIAKFKELIASKGFGDPPRGRFIYSKVCQQCHTLFETGGKVGPELTGANRNDLDYMLQNIIDPNALIPNDYRTWNIETKDDRSITGVVTKQDGRAVTIVTATETIVIPRKEVDSMSQTELSLMPEGLLQPLADDEIRDLLAYLRSPAQVPMPADAK